MDPRTVAPRWMARALFLAAAFDILGGTLLMLWPTGPLSWAGLDPARYPEAWQGVGALIAMQGFGHALAGRRPFALWPIVLVGLLGKILLTVGFVWAASVGHLSWGLGLPLLAIGPAWWLPFGMILRGALRAHRADPSQPVIPLEMALSFYRDDAGSDLLEASNRQPQFLVFLRHFGCTFCREALADLASIHERLRTMGARLVLVHMSTEDEAREMFSRYGLQHATSISDPDRVLYRAFALRRGSPTQLLGWSVWKRGWDAGVRRGHGIGWLRGDAAQMPGAFVVSRGHVVAQFVHETAADRPDYVVVAGDGIDQAEFQESLELDGVGYEFQDRLRRGLESEAAGQG